MDGPIAEGTQWEQLHTARVQVVQKSGILTQKWVQRFEWQIAQHREKLHTNNKQTNEPNKVLASEG